jgi:hypothetical protein
VIRKHRRANALIFCRTLEAPAPRVLRPLQCG